MIGLNWLVVILLFFTVFWGNGMIKKQAVKLKSAKTESKIVDEQGIYLNQAKKDIEKYKELNEVVKSVVPQDKDQAKTVREISKIATESGVTLKNITFQSSNLGQAVAPVSKDASADATKAPALPSISQVKAIDGIKDVFALEIVISNPETNPVKYEDFLTFLEKLENNRRTAHVDKLVVKPTENGTAVAFTITLNAYVKP